MSSTVGAVVRWNCSRIGPHRWRFFMRIARFCSALQHPVVPQAMWKPVVPSMPPAVLNETRHPFRASSEAAPSCGFLPLGLCPSAWAKNVRLSARAPLSSLLTICLGCRTGFGGCWIRDTSVAGMEFWGAPWSLDAA